MTPEQRNKFTADMNALHAAAHGAAVAYHAAVTDAATIFSSSRATFVASMKALENRVVQASTAHASAKQTVRSLAKEKRAEMSGDADKRLADHEKEWADLQAKNDGSPAWESRALDCLTRLLNATKP